MKSLCKHNYESFKTEYEELKSKRDNFLKERNEAKEFKHRKRFLALKGICHIYLSIKPIRT
jgi:hypothetical protein